MTQWPLPKPAPGAIFERTFFPGDGATTAFANTVMETFFQKYPNGSCMGCHGQAPPASDSVWSLTMEVPSTHNQAVLSLRKIAKAAGVAIQ